MTNIFNGVDEPTLHMMTEEANKRESCRKEQKRKGEETIANYFQVKLESAIQWERWEIELLGHLEMIVGSNGIAL